MLQNVRTQAEEVDHEILLVTLQPYLRWGGTTMLIVALASILIAAPGREGLGSATRGGAAMLRRLPVRLRGRKTSPEEEIPETRVKPEVQVIAPLVKPVRRRKRRTGKAKKARRRKRTRRKEVAAEVQSGLTAA
jgi:hypothetical protein